MPGKSPWKAAIGSSGVSSESSATGHPSAPWARGPRLPVRTGRDAPGDRLADPGNDDALPRLDGLEEP